MELGLEGEDNENKGVTVAIVLQYALFRGEKLFWVTRVSKQSCGRLDERPVFYV